MYLSRAYTRFANPVAFLARQFVDAAGKTVAGSASTCIDVGGGTTPYRANVIAAFGVHHYISIDVAPTDQTNLVADACRLPLRAACVDLVVSFDVIQHVVDAERFLVELSRIVRPGGLVLFTFPFLYAECDFRDYERWTMQGMRTALARHGFETAFEKRRGGTLFAFACGLTWIIQHLIPGQRTSWRQSRTAWSIVRSAIVALLMLPAHAFAWLALAVDGLLPVGGAYMGGAVLARRAGAETR